MGSADHQPVPHRILADRSGLYELEQVVRPARLAAGTRELVAAEWLSPHFRARNPAVDIKVADRRTRADRSDGRGVAGEQPAGERIGEVLHDLASLFQVGDGLDSEKWTEDLLAQHGRV